MFSCERWKNSIEIKRLLFYLKVLDCFMWIMQHAWKHVGVILRETVVMRTQTSAKVQLSLQQPLPVTLFTVWLSFVWKLSTSSPFQSWFCFYMAHLLIPPPRANNEEPLLADSGAKFFCSSLFCDKMPSRSQTHTQEQDHQRGFEAAPLVIPRLNMLLTG